MARINEASRAVLHSLSALPPIEQYALADQLRRAVISISLNIAEGSGSSTDKEFLRFLYMAKKSLFEVLAILKFIEKIYLKINLEKSFEQIDLVSKILEGLIKKLKASGK